MLNWSYKKIFILSVLFHLIGVIFNTGFHHFDEYFQILEYLNFKLGHTSANELSWEYQTQIRPWIQIYLYKGVVEVLGFFAVDSPFSFTMFFRLLSAVLGLGAIWNLKDYTTSFFTDERRKRISFIFLNFLWFVPYITIRPSAESLSTSFFILGFSLFVKYLDSNEIRKGLLTGALLGLSYSFRFQLAIMVMFLWFWGWWKNSSSKKFLISTAFGILILILSGVFIDYFGYGSFTFTPYNLFFQNIIQKKMASFGIDPFYFFITKGFKKGIPPISLMLIISYFFCLWKYRREAFVWVTLPFFLFHSYLGHKELRFIFPILPFASLALCLFLKSIPQYFERAYKILLPLNLLILIVSVSKSAKPAVNFYRYIYNEKITNIAYSGENPFSMLGLPVKFYKRASLRLHKAKSKEELRGNEYIFLRTGSELLEYNSDSKCELKYSNYPMWAVQNFNIGNWVKRSRVWSLYRCEKI